jgi:phosphate transport system permease protein
MMSASLTVTAPSATATLDLRRRPRRLERLAEGAIVAVAILSILSVALILVFVGKEALPVLFSENVHEEVTPASMILPRIVNGEEAFLWQPVSEVPKYNIVPLFLGSLKVTLVALLFAVPISVAAAVHCAEYARPRVREVLKPAVELMAGVPSVVAGFFALVVLATWVQKVFGTEHRLNAMVAGLGLAFATCPVIFSVSEDALRSVPQSYRTAALALGSTPTQALFRVILPAAMPGIGAGIMLGFGRAIGETLIVVLASGNAALMDLNLGHSTRTVTATIAQELGEVVVGSAHYHVLFGLGALLFLVTFVVNVVTERALHRSRQALTGSKR